jgi:hypothetical protein
MSLGGTRVGEFYENALPWTKNAFWVAMEGLWARSDLRQADVDLFYPYDGYTIDAVAIVEAADSAAPARRATIFATSGTVVRTSCASMAAARWSPPRRRPGARPLWRLEPLRRGGPAASR